VGTLVLTACSSTGKEKPPTTAASPVLQTSVTTKPGVAGSVTEDVFIIEAIVSAVDVPGHRVTLKGPEGREFTFDVSPQIKDLSQLKVGDKVTSTFSRRVFIGVRRDDAPPSETYETTWGTSGPGEKPGRLSAQESKKVGRVVAIDPVNRMADIQFADGVVKRVQVRPDVDLSKYKVGDNVIMRVTTSLTVLSQTP
jgi:hypothetical protein